VSRLTVAMTLQAMKWMMGAATIEQVRERSNRQRQFALLRHGRSGG